MQTGWNKSLRRSQIFAAILSLAVAVISVVGLSTAFQRPRTEAEVSSYAKDLDQKLSAIAERVKALESSKLQIKPSLGESSDRGLALRLNALQGNIDRLDSAISDSPEEAVSVVLLKRDIQDLRRSQDGMASSVSREIDRVYDMTKWLFGLFLTMALSILTLAFTALSKTVQREPVQEKVERSAQP
jgi:hypothetical protein